MTPSLVKTYSPTNVIAFESNELDGIHITHIKDGMASVPKEVARLSDLRTLAAQLGPQVVYRHFVTLYDMAAAEIDVYVLRLIDALSGFYGTNAQLANETFTLLYADMVAAEANDADIPGALGKRVTRLGVHLALMTNVSAADAIHLTHEIQGAELNSWCVRYGF